MTFPLLIGADYVRQLIHLQQKEREWLDFEIQCEKQIERAKALKQHWVEYFAELDRRKNGKAKP